MSQLVPEAKVGCAFIAVPLVRCSLWKLKGLKEFYLQSGCTQCGLCKATSSQRVKAAGRR